MSEELVQEIAQAIVDKKGFNIIALDVRGISSITDYFIIAEGNVERHVKALADVVRDILERDPNREVRVEGLDSPEWVVVDTWDVVVHLFTPQLRQKYQLERLWQEAKIIDLELDYSPIARPKAM